MTVANLVKVTHFLVRPNDMAAYATVRAGYLLDAQPASTVLIVQASHSGLWKSMRWLASLMAGSRDEIARLRATAHPLIRIH